MKEYSSQVKTVQTIGLDLGDRYSFYVVLDEGGQVVEEGRVRTRQQDLQKQFSSFGPSRVALEAGGQSAWISRLLRTLNHEVLVAQPRNWKALWGGATKTDQVDAECLARMARVEPKLLRPIRHREEQRQRDLVVVRGRDQLVGARSKLINSVRGQLKQFGLRMGSMSTEVFARRVGPQLPQDLKSGLGPLVATIAELNDRIRQLDGEIERLCQEEYPETQRLRQIRGVGPITALTFVLVLEDPAEFGHNRDVGPYLGLTPKKHQSGDSDPQLGISKRGNGMLRRLLVQAAHYILGPFAQDSDLRRQGEKLASRGGEERQETGGRGDRPQARGGAPAVVAQWAGVSTLVQRAAAGGRLGLSASTPGELIRRLKKESF